jgi:hypothetical protein
MVISLKADSLTEQIIITKERWNFDWTSANSEKKTLLPPEEM